MKIIVNIDLVESFFRRQQQLYGNLADPKQFQMIFGLIAHVRQAQEENAKLLEENDKLTSLNRHYCNHFYGGDLDKMAADFKYLME